MCNIALNKLTIKKNHHHNKMTCSSNQMNLNNIYNITRLNSSGSSSKIQQIPTRADKNVIPMQQHEKYHQYPPPQPIYTPPNIPKIKNYQHNYRGHQHHHPNHSNHQPNINQNHHQYNNLRNCDYEFKPLNRNLNHPNDMINMTKCNYNNFNYYGDSSSKIKAIIAAKNVTTTNKNKIKKPYLNDIAGTDSNTSTITHPLPPPSPSPPQLPKTTLPKNFNKYNRLNNNKTTGSNNLTTMNTNTPTAASLTKSTYSTKSYVQYSEKSIKYQMEKDDEQQVPHHNHHHQVYHHKLMKNESNGTDSRTDNLGKHMYKSHHYTQIIAAIAVSLGPLAAGLGKGYSSPALASLQELQDLQLRHRGNYTTFTVTDQQASWVASLSFVGALFGGMFGGLAMQYGRRRLLAIMSLPFSFSWILTVFAKSVETMFATAFFGGFCCAIISMVTQVYVSEISSPDIRGFLSAIQKIAGHMGIMISFSLGAYLDWRQLAMLVSVAPMMLFVTVIYIPETPSFLVLKGRDEEAYRSLQWLRGPYKNVEFELETIKSNVRLTKLHQQQQCCDKTTTTSTTTNNNNNNNNNNKKHEISTNSSLNIQRLITRASVDTMLKTIKSLLQNTRLIKPILITCGLMVFQRFTGANSFGFYAVKIFRQTFAGMNPHGGAIAVGFVQLLASMLSGLLIDTVGRIPLLIISSVFMSLALASFGSYIYYEETSKMATILNFDVETTATNSDWIPLLCVLVFTIAFSLGISPISSLLVGELFPLEYRGLGSSISTSFSYFCAFLSVKTFIDFQELLGLHGAFWLYACISCLGLFFVVMCVPETKGKDLDEMDPKFTQQQPLSNQSQYQQYDHHQQQQQQQLYQKQPEQQQQHMTIINP